MGRGPNGAAAERMRARIVDRDGRGCAYCRNGAPAETLRLEHVIPYSRGGPNSIENRVLACQRCDLAKGARTPQEWRPGVVWGNPVIDQPTTRRIKRRVKAPEPEPWERERRKGESTAQAEARRRKERPSGQTTVAFCATEGRWVKVPHSPSNHLLLDDAIHEP